VAKKVVKKSIKAAGKRAGAPKAKKAKASCAKALARPKAASAGKTTANKAVGKTPTKKAPAKSRAAKKATPKRLTKSPLTKPQLRQFRELLLAKRRDLLGDMDGIQAEAIASNGSDLSNVPTHPADVGTDNFEQEFTLGLLESERTLLAEIGDALKRIEAGTYGICVGMGKAINISRLKARPWAKYSIEYARMMEQGLVSPLDEDDLSDDEDAKSPDDDATKGH